MVGGVGLGDKHAGWMVEVATSGTVFPSTLFCIHLLLCAFFGKIQFTNLQFTNTIFSSVLSPASLETLTELICRARADQIPS